MRVCKHSSPCFRPCNSIVYKRNVPTGIVTKHGPWEVPHREELPTARVFLLDRQEAKTGGWRLEAGGRKAVRNETAVRQNEPQHADKTQATSVRARAAHRPRFLERRSARSGQNRRIVSAQTCFTAPDKSSAQFITRTSIPAPCTSQLETHNSPPGTTQCFADVLHRKPNHIKAIRPRPAT